MNWKILIIIEFKLTFVSELDFLPVDHRSLVLTWQLVHDPVFLVLDVPGTLFVLKLLFRDVLYFQVLIFYLLPPKKILKIKYPIMIALFSDTGKKIWKVGVNQWKLRRNLKLIHLFSRIKNSNQNWMGMVKNIKY